MVYIVLCGGRCEFSSQVRRRIEQYFCIVKGSSKGSSVKGSSVKGSSAKGSSSEAVRWGLGGVGRDDGGVCGVEVEARVIIRRRRR